MAGPTLQPNARCFVCWKPCVNPRTTLHVSSAATAPSPCHGDCIEGLTGYQILATLTRALQDPDYLGLIAAVEAI